MRVVEVARFASLIEAQIAAGALRSAGFQAEVYDADLGSVNFFMHQAIGGFRLMMPQAEQQEARALLSAIEAEAPPRQAASTGGPLRALGALLLAFWLGPAGGFLTAKTSRRLPDD